MEKVVQLSKLINIIEREHVKGMLKSEGTYKPTQRFEKTVAILVKFANDKTILHAAER